MNAFRDSLAELVEICRHKCSPTDDVILPDGRTNHAALCHAVALLGPVSETISAASNAARATYGTDAQHEIAEAVYDEALGAVPPVYGRGCFWLGEAYSHDPDGCETALECWAENHGDCIRYFCRFSRVGEGTPPRGRLMSFAH